jgi:Protein of unknown function (DUF4238)
VRLAPAPTGASRILAKRMTAFRHSHIVSAGYLRAWSVDGLIGVGWADGAAGRSLPVSEVGVRSGFYRERLPDSTTSDWLEPAMGVLEDKALTVIRSIEGRWPLEGEDRGRVCEFMALQLMRSPAWRDWYGDAVATAAAHVKESEPPRSERSIQQATEYMASDTERHQRIVRNLGAAGTIFANMRWTLLRCGSPRLATSDQPLVPVPIGAGGPIPLSPVPPAGLQYVHEVRLAVSPRLLLLLTWADDFSEERISKAAIDQVRNHNGSVVAHADVQWFHLPDGSPERVAGPWRTLAEGVHGKDYEPRGHRWRHVEHAIGEMTQGDEPEPDIRLIEWGVPRAPLG